MGGSGQDHDPELARRARAGSLTAFDEFVGRYHGRVFAFLVSLTRHRQDAEDLTQETFIRAWRKIRQLDPARPPLPWLLTIARRQSIAALRRKRPPPQLDTAAATDPWTAHHDDPPARRLWELAGRTLSRDACAALWLHYREELPLDEVASILGKRTGAVKTMLHRARNALAAAAHRPPRPPAAPPPLPTARRASPPSLPAQLTVQTTP